MQCCCWIHKAKESSFSTSAAGGAIIHGNGITIGSQLGETNALVQAPGASGLPIIGKTGVKTDFQGYAVVPYVDSYRRNRIALDTKQLKNNVELENNIKFVVPTRGAIVNKSNGFAISTFNHSGNNVTLIEFIVSKVVIFALVVFNPFIKSTGFGGH